jgi:hypothetical protein
MRFQHSSSPLIRVQDRRAPSRRADLNSLLFSSLLFSSLLFLATAGPVRFRRGPRAHLAASHLPRLRGRVDLPMSASSPA